MSVVQKNRTCRLVVRMNEGTTANPTYKKYGLTNWAIDPGASNEDCLTVGTQYGACHQGNMDAVLRYDRNSLVNE